MLETEGRLNSLDMIFDSISYFVLTAGQRDNCNERTDSKKKCQVAAADLERTSLSVPIWLSMVARHNYYYCGFLHTMSHNTACSHNETEESEDYIVH